jgi:hypothetical protein
MATEVDIRALADRVGAVADRQEIHDVLMRYCRGIDRGDAEMIGSVFHEGAVDRHGNYQFGDVRTELPAITVPRLDAFAGIAQHHITNYLIELDGDSAAVESYFLAFNPTYREDGSEALGVVGGRYMDRFERRDDRWAIAERWIAIDWSRREIPGEDWPDAKHFPPGARREADPSHELFATG